MTDDERIAALKAERDRALARAYELSAAYLRTLDERHVGPLTDARGIRERLRSELSDEGEDAEAVVTDMAAALDPGIVASTGPRYFGFVIGGALPAAVGRRLLTRAWNQNGALHALSPAAAAAEEIAGEWMLDLLGLPPDASVGFPTGAGLGNAVGMAAARHAAAAARRLGRGGGRPVRGAGDRGDHRRRGARHGADRAAVPGLRPRSRDAHRRPTSRAGCGLDALRPRWRRWTPSAADGRSLQAGNVNTGGFDPAGEIADAVASTRTRGCTSTAPSACGRPSPRTCATWSPGSRRPTHGRPTPTSG